MAEALRLLMVGLPESGKTTFLAAVWRRVNDADATSSLRLEHVGAEDKAYLNEIARAWNRHEPVPRTPIGTSRRVVMHLADDEGQPVTLMVPDLSGESFRTHLHDRRWDEQYAELVRTCAGLLLFIHPDDVIAPVGIDEAERLIRSVEPSEGGDLGDPPSDEDDQELPAATAAVELLQFHQHRRPRLPTAVIVSAWDLIEDGDLQPRDWLRTEMPLLHQYLIANEHRRPYAVFGISAQGGDYEDDREELVQMDPGTRMRIVADGRRGNDLTEPIAWAARHKADGYD